MSELSNKKRKFIKRNFKQLSLEELSLKTGLKPNLIRPLIEEYRAETPEENQSSHIENRTSIFPSWKAILVTFLIFAAVASIIYSPSLHGDFVFDDKHIKYNYTSLIHITKLSQLTDILFSKEIDRRIGYMSFALNYYLGELNSFGYHLANVIIHILNGLVLFLLSHTILILTTKGGQGRGDALKISFLGSLLWLVHPIQIQAVSYIVQRLTSLAALFFLLSLFCYIKARMSQSYKKLALFLLSIFLGILALGTKENTATLPFFIVVVEFFFLQQHPFKMNRKKLGLIMLVVGLFILISGIYLGSDFISRMALKYEHRGWTPLERVLTQFRVVVLYLTLLIYPHPSRLNVDHDLSISSSLFSPFTTFLSLLLIIGLLLLAVFQMRRNRLVSYAIFWFFGNLVIESSIIPLVLVFEHRVYLPSMGLIILVVGLCVGLSNREWKKWVAGLIILLVLLFSYWTYVRTSVWNGPVSLWMDAIKKSPYKTRPYFKLGEFYRKKGRLDEAIAKFEQILSLDPNSVSTHNNLGLAYFRQGKLDEAISAYKKALSLNPNLAKVHSNLGDAYSKKDRLDEAISAYKKALTINPNYAKVHNNLGDAYAKKGRLDEAIFACKKALAINPDYAVAHISLSEFYYYKRDYKAAITYCDKAIELGYSVDQNFLELLKPYR